MTDDELLRMRVLNRRERLVVSALSPDDLERMNVLAYRRRHRDAVSRDRWRVINSICATLRLATYPDEDAA